MLTCAQKLTHISQLYLPHGSKLKEWEREKTKKKLKTDMLRSIGRL